ncbi:MAG: FAD:protein FMN transferase, partial [Deltaproteobacteria bacterium]|nr:FAD:protein FMN transferase [Deltaproteobacteria bacterium]
MFGRKDTKVEIRIPRHPGCADPPRFSANLVAAAVTKADRLLSPDSEGGDVRRLNEAGASRWVAVDPLTVIAVKAALKWNLLSGGVFEPALGPLKALWKSCSASGEPPREADLRKASELSRSANLACDPAGSRLSWTLDGCSLDLGGLAEGLAADIGLETLLSRGVVNASVRIGGAVRHAGLDPKTGAPWDPGFADPLGSPLVPRQGPPSLDSRPWRAAAFCGYSGVRRPGGGAGADVGGEAPPPRRGADRHDLFALYGFRGPLARGDG